LESGKAATPEVTNRKVITAADIEALNADRHSCGHALNRNPACGCMCGRSYLPDWGVLISRQGRFPPACKCVPVPPAAQVTDVAKLRWLRDHMSQAVHDFGISGRHDVSMHLEFALGNIDKALTAKKEGS
jgi:hypothetical protein